ncbi:MAG: 2-hydroxychromene-2-carboxylate isomerase [Myxococcota bacterium]|jgi:2-hydroxychromene-2-carboxylate isomerase
MATDESVKLYFDYKSPFAYLAAEPAFALPTRYRVDVRWIPFTLRIKGKGERSQYSEWKARYSYLDARRWANRRGGFPIRGPRKVYDTQPALIGGLFAQRAGVFREFTLQAYARFFDHRLELDVAEQVAALLAECGASADEYRAFLAGDGPRALDACIDEAHADHVFGVPLFFFRGEPFWGNDRIEPLEERLRAAGLARS